MKKSKMAISAAALLLAAALSATAEGSRDSGKAGAQVPEAETGTITWWDHYAPLAPMHQEMWTAYAAAKPGVKVEYTQYEPNKLKDALPLAFASKQLPDVFANVMGMPDVALQQAGWYQPMTVEKAALSPIVQQSLFEGYTLFGGKVYSLPTLSNKNHPAALWYNKELVKKAGYPTEDIPSDYASIREIAKKVTEQGSGKVYGIIMPLKFVIRMQSTIMDLAMAAGAPGEGNVMLAVDWKTGKYVYDGEAYRKVFAFIKQLIDDGSLHPASLNLDMRQARERWVNGEAALMLDGSWNIGVVAGSFASFADKVGVASSVPVPTKETKPYIYRGPVGGTFFISSNSKNPKKSTDILLKFMSQEYYVKLAERMDQPPLDTGAVAKANVHPTYKRVVANFEREMRFAPSPVIRNPDVSIALSRMRAITPNLGEIAQGMAAGAIADYAAALSEFNKAVGAERDRAIAEVKAEGKKVGVDDWIFSNWVPGKDYSQEMYK